MSTAPARTATHLAELAAVEVDAGEHGAAEHHALEAVAVFESLHGPDHPALVDPLEALAKAQLGLGRPAAAIDPLTRALALIAAAWGEDHVYVAIERTTLAQARRLAGDPEAAVVDARAAVRIAAAHDPQRLRDARVELARALHAAGRSDEAVALARTLLPELDAAGATKLAAEFRGWTDAGRRPPRPRG